MSSKIEWTNETWNPLAGCSPVSEGCRNCYAAREALRLAGNPHPKIAGAYEGTAEMRGAGDARRPVFTGRVNLLPDRLEQPLRWRKPRRVFVNSMSDLFHPDVPEGFIVEVFAVMALAQEHTFQVLTKRPERMAEFLLAEGREDDVQFSAEMIHGGAVPWNIQWPLPNVWLGTSVEDQAAADERIPHLLRCPAAVRFLSCEPLLGPVDLERPTRAELDAAFRAGVGASHAPGPVHAGLHWIIAGGESGPSARPCNVAWIRSLVRQGQAAGVPVFCKQLGAEVRWSGNAPAGGWWPDGVTAREAAGDPRHGAFRVALTDRKGGDPEEWPQDLRVREFPQQAGVAP